MRIDIASLVLGDNSWQETTSPDSLELESDNFCEDIIVDLSAEKREGKIILEVRAKTNGNFICFSCGDDFNRELDGSCTVMFVQRQERFPEEMPGDDLRSILVGQTEIDITTEVCDALLLSLPYRLLCKDDCKGICFNCGENLNRSACKCE